MVVMYGLWLVGGNVVIVEMLLGLVVGGGDAYSVVVERIRADSVTTGVGDRHCWTHVLFSGIVSGVCRSGDGVLNISPICYCNGWIWMTKV